MVWLLLYICILVVFVGCRADFVAKKMLFHPEKLPTDWQPAQSRKFSRCEEAFFELENGQRLHGVYFPCPGSRGTLLFSHGNGGNVGDWGEVGAILRDRLNVSVFVYDYRGYGKSEGKPTAAGILDDARAARKWLAKRENILESEIIMMGRSLGGAVAIDLAAEGGAKALIVESTFTSLPDMAGEIVPWVPARLLLHEQLTSIDKIGRYKGPYFGSHGTDDTLIPFSQGERLFAAAGGREKVFCPLTGGHNEMPPRSYYEKLYRFLDEIERKTANQQKNDRF